MDMKVANSWWMYLLGALVVVFVLAGCIFFILKAVKEAKKVNMDSKLIKKVIFNSALFTILPSISILIGVVALSGVLGVPLPWIRLSVIGALHYEGAAVNAALDAFGTNVITNEVFVTIACVMTLGILTGPLFCLFDFKAYDKKILARAKAKEEAPKVEKEKEEVEEEKVVVKPKKDFGSVLFSAVFIAMVSSFLAVDMVKLVKTGKVDSSGVAYTPMESFVPTIVIVVTFLSMIICDVLERKFKQRWLSSFALGLSMLVGMASAVLFNYLATLG